MFLGVSNIRSTHCLETSSSLEHDMFMAQNSPESSDVDGFFTLQHVRFCYTADFIFESQPLQTPRPKM